MTSAYRSSIPSAAREKIVTRYPDGKKEQAEFWLNRKLVGIRVYFESGEPVHEYAIKDGKKHGTEYWWHDPGVLDSAEPFVDGLPHGIAKQWHYDGRLLGTYKMHRGTGIDLWRLPSEDGSIYLSEALYLCDGQRHGFEWRLEKDQKSVYIERHWQHDKVHGIERHWNHAGRLRRGYPKYFVDGEQVRKAKYVQVCLSDPTLPKFRLKDNAPARTFSAEIAKHLRKVR